MACTICHILLSNDDVCMAIAATIVMTIVMMPTMPLVISTTPPRLGYNARGKIDTGENNGTHDKYFLSHKNFFFG